MSRVLTKVRATIQAHNLFAPGQTVVVAVSGGADSLCLLHVLWSLRDELGLTLHVAHLDHQLRGQESAADARFVADLAASMGLAATVEARDVARYRREHRLTLEEAAREVRYAFLRQVAGRAGAVAVATGHTADDNVETILLHWLRGAGLAGMRGMSPGGKLQATDYSLPLTSASLQLIRPLLNVTRAETEAYCAAYGLLFRQDASNQDERMLRNRLRLRLLPELAKYNPNLRATLLRAAAAADDDYDYLRGQVLAAWPGIVVEPQRTPSAQSEDALPLRSWRSLRLNRSSFRALHPALQRGILREALERVWGGWQDFGWVHLESARQAVVAGRVGTVVHLPHGLAVTVGYETAVLGSRGDGETGGWGDREMGSSGPLLHVDSLPVAVPGETVLPETTWRLVVQEIPPKFPQPTAAISGELAVNVDADVVGAALALRRPQPGDRFQPLGMAGSKKLQDLFVDEKLPRAWRKSLPVLVAPPGIVWVAGRYLADWARVRPETQRLLRLSFVLGIIDLKTHK